MEIINKITHVQGFLCFMSTMEIVMGVLIFQITQFFPLWNEKPPRNLQKKSNKTDKLKLLSLWNNLIFPKKEY